MKYYKRLNREMINLDGDETDDSLEQAARAEMKRVFEALRDFHDLHCAECGIPVTHVARDLKDLLIDLYEEKNFDAVLGLACLWGDITTIIDAEAY